MTYKEMMASAPEGKFMTTAKIGQKGQIVIPKEIRDMFHLSPGDSVVILADKDRGIAIQEQSVLTQILNQTFPPEVKNE